MIKRKEEEENRVTIRMMMKKKIRVVLERGVLLNYLLFSLLCLFLTISFLFYWFTIFCGWMVEFEDKAIKYLRNNRANHFYTYIL